MRIRRPATLAVGLLVVAFPVLAGGALAGGGGPSAASAKQHATVAYWTPERLKAAIPRDFVRDAKGFHLQPQKGKPGGGGGGGGGGGNGLANTAGASWTNGRGSVYAVTGKVYFVMSGQAYVCSGTAIANARADYAIVLTAGHCVYDETNGGGQLSGFATNWEFIPQFDSTTTFTCASTAYGCWPAQALVANAGFTNAGGFTTAATHYDWGFAIVGTGTKGGQLDSLGTFGLTPSSMSASTVVDAFGYPAAGKYHGNDLTYCQNPLGFDALTGNSNYKLACGMTGGSSGGPWFSGFDSTGSAGSIRSLNSYGYSGQSNMYGPIFNANTTATFNVANNDGTLSNTIVH